MEPNKNVIMWLVIFPPLGVVRVWTLSTWGKKTKIIITALIVAYFIAATLVSVLPILYVRREISSQLVF